MNLSVMLWRDTGCPAPSITGPFAPGACYVCGTASDLTISLARGLGDSFTAHDQCAGISDQICAACAWCMAGRSSKTLHTWRLYSVLWREDGAVPKRIHPAAPDGGPRAWCGNRSDLRPMLRALLSPPLCAWSVSLAVSGQVQCVPFAPVIPAGGAPVVLFERSLVPVSLAPQLMPHVAALRQLGVSAEDVTSGRPSVAACMQIGDARKHLDALRPHRGSLLVQLLAWALKRDHAEEFL